MMIMDGGVDAADGDGREGQGRTGTGGVQSKAKAVGVIGGSVPWVFVRVLGMVLGSFSLALTLTWGG